MPVLTKIKFTPIPEGIYNLKIVRCEIKEQKSSPGTYYLLWTIEVLDPLPEDFTGKSTFGVITADVLTENNNLSKFFSNIGVDIGVGEEIDTDSLMNYKFVGKVVTTTNKKTGAINNSIGQVTIPEYENFKARQVKQAGRPAVKQVTPVARQAVPTANQPVQQPRPVARPTAAVPATKPRPTAVQTPEPVAVENEATVSADDVEQFPDELP